MPISTIMLETVRSDGIRCESGAIRPIVAATLVPASSTGMPAAISAPKASSIRTSVTGRLITSADVEVVADLLVDRLVDGDVAGLADVQVGVRRRGGRPSVTA